MSDRDWFRNEKWDRATELWFFEKLRRARDKAQPLRIQARYLVHENPKAALALLDQYFALGDHFDKAQAYLDQAEAYLTLGQQEEAIQSLRNALERERDFPNLKTEAWSRYALLVGENKLDHLYDDALEVLKKNSVQPQAFPLDGFHWNAACALIADGRGLRDDAAKCAYQALKFAELTHSGFRYHPKLGLVGPQYNDLKAKLRRIAER